MPTITTGELAFLFPDLLGIKDGPVGYSFRRRTDERDQPAIIHENSRHVIGRDVTVLYGHIHRDHDHEEGHAKHHAARSLIFAFPDPESTAEKKPLPFDKDHPFRNLGIHTVAESGRGEASVRSIELGEVELSLREFSGTEGIQQILKAGVME